MGAHHHHHHHHVDPDASVKRLFIAFILNLSFALIEFVGGILFQSMAVIADAIHDLGDSLSLGLALVLQKKSQKSATKKFTYGFKRYSTAGALINSVILIVGSAIVLWESIPQLFADNALPHYQGMMGLAVVGVVVNSFAAWKLSGGHNHNEKIISLHLLEDVLGWIAVLVGGILIHFFQWTWIDPLLACLIALFILKNVWSNFTTTARIFLQSIPENIDMDQVESALTGIDGVKEIANFHVWTLDGSDHVCTCTIVPESEKGPFTDIKAAIRDCLKAYHFKHVTIEVATHPSEICH